MSVGQAGAILVVAETRGGVIAPTSLEALGLATELATRGSADRVVVLVVAQEPDQLSGQLGVAGVDEVVTVSAPDDRFEPHVVQVAIEAAVARTGASVVILGHTIDAIAVGPAVAAAQGWGLATDVTAVAIEDGQLVARRPFYGGKLEGELVFPEHEVVVLMVRAGQVEPAAPAAQAAPIVPLEFDGASAQRTEHVGYEQAETEDVDITSAELLLSIGRGVDEESEVVRFESLAARMGGTLSASRPLVDVGWVSSARQVGQSEQTVAPKVYLAFGISGAVQHLAGIRSAETIIAVNTDPDAPIYRLAHYGVVADLFDVADELDQLFE